MAPLFFVIAQFRLPAATGQPQYRASGSNDTGWAAVDLGAESRVPGAYVSTGSVDADRGNWWRTQVVL